MKIAMIGHKRIPSREGGIEVVVEELSTRMAELGHDVTVYNRKGKNVAGYTGNGVNAPQKDKFEYKGVHVRTVFTFKNKALNALVYSYLATKKACRSKCDVIHFHAEGPCAFIPIAKRRGKRVIATIHGLDWKRGKWGGIASKFLKYGERMAVEHADEIIVLSENDQKYFKSKYNRKTTLIPNGINMPEYSEPKVIRLKHTLNGNDYMLFVARIVPEKGVHTLVEAYSKSGIEVPLVIAGGSSHSEEYYRTIKKFAEKFNDKASRARRKARIVMTGFIQGRELEELYSNAVMYILPSEIEGMPISLMEAMSYGNICLVSDIPENTAVVGNNGFCFENKSVESLRDSMRDIIGHLNDIRELPEYSKEAIARNVLEQYDWDKIVKKTLGLYKSGKIKDSEPKTTKSKPQKSKNAKTKTVKVQAVEEDFEDEE